MVPQRIQGRSSDAFGPRRLAFCRRDPPPAREAFAAKRPSISSLRFERRLSNDSFIQSHFGLSESLYFCLLSLDVSYVSLSSSASAIFSSVSANDVSSVTFFVFIALRALVAVERCCSNCDCDF